MLQVCINGARSRAESPRLPVTAAELAVAAHEAVAAGAEDIHLHPKDRDGQDTLEAAAVAAAVSAVRAAAPGVPVGVTTGAWAVPDPHLRAAHVRSWTVLPDHASVNWHEDGAAEVAAALLERGVGVEAGIYSGTPAAQRFLDWPGSARVLRVLAEVIATGTPDAVHAAEGLLAELSSAAAPILLHGEDASAWPVLRLAAAQRLDTRIGMEDVLNLPDGQPAAGNAALVRAARGIIQHERLRTC
ncbi:3-keto-5-aminohexanoate cleavage protein [Streptomyces drozdowiczii]|uniref:3-keto-5-aminohexanoate cleavage protein n=1 Tax=Streptomyces drozdowiczii TaxID=202862 RepID=A0ABY6Q0S7_9ACTN|nr:3-keto-5-aminohexanoate cleavage protein [Streptomyces drozdowiczii]MCX0242066.1 3-keto-5-aminohexanoate cleavage protein [Streptomyces drozdowiczii]UZK57839.1 3-keto-5-aminohexanoate cleavage protein [Streptomyces drozdowiczii]